MMENNSYRIVHVNEFFYPFVAGPSKRILDMARNVLRPENHTVVSFDRSENLSHEEIREGIPVRRFESISHDDLHRLVHLRYSVADKIKPFVQYARSLKPTCVSIYWIDKVPSIVINAIPEMRFVYTPYTFRKSEFSVLFCNPRVKIVLFDRKSIPDFVKAGAAQTQIHIAEKPIDVDFFQPNGAERDPHRMLYVGRIFPTKQLCPLISSLENLFRDFTDLTFHIVGDLNPTFANAQTKKEIQKIRDLTDSLKISDRVIFKGRRVGQDLIREYSEASIHLMAGCLERKNTSTQEALAMGLQCVNFNKQSFDWPEFDDSGEKLIHYVDRIEGFDAAIRRLLEIQHNSHRDFAIRHWSWNKWKPVYEDIYTHWKCP